MAGDAATASAGNQPTSGDAAEHESGDAAGRAERSQVHAGPQSGRAIHAPRPEFAAKSARAVGFEQPSRRLPRTASKHFARRSVDSYKTFSRFARLRPLVLVDLVKRPTTACGFSHFGASKNFLRANRADSKILSHS